MPNTGIQPVFSHYKAATYMCAYFSKVEHETSEAMKQAAKETSMSGKSNFEKMRVVVRACSVKRECSVQEAIIFTVTKIMVTKNISKGGFPK